MDHNPDYNFKPDSYSSHTRILNLVPSNSRVLDIGCYEGHLARMLKNRNCEVTGVEKLPKAAEKARAHCSQVITVDIEKEEIDLPANSFDVIILADILSFFVNPDSVLSKLRPALKENGRLILSNGNVANIYIRLNLLLGKFDYQEKGILEHSHVKLYTHKNLKALLARNKFEIVQTAITPIPLLLVFPALKDNFLFLKFYQGLYYFSLLFKNLFAYQFVFSCKKIN
jgi:2-polyprenyl-3-methyl-5-hydroxy-6-metoxy-1,4-benzoquinol methylase